MKFQYIVRPALSSFLFFIGNTSTFAYYNDAAAADGNDDAAANSGGSNYYQVKDDDDKINSYSGNDFIKYWTEYAVLPKSCIHIGGKDMIAYSMYEKYYNHCADKPIGNYMVDVQTFMTAYVNQLQLNAQDMIYGDGYTVPDSTYVNCYPYETNNGVYYVQLGCTDGNSQSLSVNVYKDNTCTQHDRNANGVDDTTIAVSSKLQPPFGQCTSCVHFVDKNEDDVDDRYFENRMKNAPLCESLWEYKKHCGGTCKRMANKVARKGWNSSDKLLLTVLGIFSIVMIGLIQKKRSKMSPKDALLEEAALSSAGIQQNHVLGIFAITFFFIVLFGLAGFKGLTWTLLLLVNFFLFGYLMKLTIDSGLNVPVGPDGEPIEDDSSDDDDDDDGDVEEVEGYKAPPVSSATHGEEKQNELPPIT